MPYTIKTTNFEGPLDLLLTLIENQKLDISKFSISQVTDDYLAAVASLKQTNEEIADFLVLASRLLYLKSKSLLPSLPEEEEEIDDLEKQLKEYKKYKEASEELARIQDLGKRIFKANFRQKKMYSFLPPGDVSLDTLFNILREVISRMPQNEITEKKMEPKISLEERLKFITAAFDKNKRISFKKLMGQSSSKMEVVVTFLAVLEMVKRKLIVISQKSNFGDLTLKKI